MIFEVYLYIYVTLYVIITGAVGALALVLNVIFRLFPDATTYNSGTNEMETLDTNRTLLWLKGEGQKQKTT